MRVQFQVSPHESGTVTFETFAQTVEEEPGQSGVGVTTRQIDRLMESMFNNRPAWMPAGFERGLLGLIARTSIKIHRFPPFGTDGRRIEAAREQIYYNGIYYRIDVENMVGFNLKE